MLKAMKGEGEVLREYGGNERSPWNTCDMKADRELFGDKEGIGRRRAGRQWKDEVRGTSENKISMRIP